MLPDLFALLFFAVTVTDPSNVDGQHTDVADYIARAKCGEREAVAVLYQLYVRPIHRYITLRVGDAHDAEDLTAEVFVNMVKGLSRYETTGAPFAAWLYKIASARIADYYRIKAGRVIQDTDETLRDSEFTPEESIQRQEALDELRKALSRLSEEQQMLLIMRFVERKSHADVALAMGKSVAAVKSIQHRALISLTEMLGSQDKIRHYLRGTRE